MTVLITAYVCLCLGFCAGMRTAAGFLYLANRKTSTGGL